MARRGNPRWNEMKMLKQKDKKVEREWLNAIKDDEKEVKHNGKEEQNIFKR